MTVSDVVLALPQPRARVSHPAIADRQRRRRAFHAARRHSRHVRSLRVLLPVCGILVLVGLMAVTRSSMPADVALDTGGLTVSRNAVVMERPHLTGFDSQNRGYSVSAERAIQTITEPNKVRLEAIQAIVGEDTESPAHIRAEAGDYDATAGTLRLQGGIEVDSPQGISIRMRDADIDLNAGTMSSPNAVAVRYEGGETTGASISVTGRGKVILLQGGVRTTITPKTGDLAPSPPVEE